MEKEIKEIEWEEATSRSLKVSLPEKELLSKEGASSGEVTIAHFTYADGSGESVEAKDLAPSLENALRQAQEIAREEEASGRLEPYRQMGFKNPIIYELFRFISERRSFDDPEALREWMSDSEDILMDSAIFAAVDMTEDWAGEEGVT